MPLFKLFKIYDNELCPCGSGMNYEQCCKNRNDKQKKLTKKPVEVQVMEKLRASHFKCCLHPDKSKCVKHIKEAHALQNNKIISRLSEDVHVYMMNTKKPPLIVPIGNEEPEVIVEIDKVGVNHATTASCFCDVHDDEAFALIEKDAPNLKKTSEAHKFIYAYKAFIFEYYKKLVEQHAFANEVRDRPSLLKVGVFVRQYRAIMMTLKEMDQIKIFFDTRVLAKDYTGLKTCILELPECINFANYACVALDFDLEGNKIRCKRKGFISRLFITIFPEETKSFILLSCMKEDYRIYQQLFQQLQSTNLNKVKYYFNLVLPLYSENIVISPRLWHSWSDEQQFAYTFYANRIGKQFVLYKKMLAMGMHNLKKQISGFEDGHRGKLDLFLKT